MQETCLTRWRTQQPPNLVAGWVRLAHEASLFASQDQSGGYPPGPQPSANCLRATRTAFVAMRAAYVAIVLVPVAILAAGGTMGPNRD